MSNNFWEISTPIPVELGINTRNQDICVQLQDHDIVMIIETWYDGSYIHNVETDGYRLFTKDKPQRRGSGVVLYVTEHLECMETTESIKEQPGVGDITLDVCSRLPGKEKQAGETFCRQVEQELWSGVLFSLSEK